MRTPALSRTEGVPTVGWSMTMAANAKEIM